MKKQYLTAVVVTLALAVLLPACSHEDGDNGGGGEDVSLVGTWDAVSATVTSPELPAPVTVTSAFGMLSGYVTFNADNTFNMQVTISVIGESQTLSGTWSASSSELKISSTGQGGEGTYTVSGSTLVVEYSQDGSHISISASKR